MIEEEKISSVRKSVVAIGLADSDGQKPLVYQGKPMVEGTGFLIAKRGYIMTASHVLHRCKSHQSSIGGNPKIGFFSIVVNAKLEVSFEFCEILKALEIGKDVNVLGYPGPRQLDIAIGTFESENEFSSLEIRKLNTVNVNDEIFVCGYPGTWQSIYYNKIGMYAGIKLGASIQHGKIASLLPLNECSKPYAIQTNIMSTTGYSGSPIIDSNGQVIAMSQQAIWGEADAVAYNDVGHYYDQSLPEQAISKMMLKVGIVSGISNYILYGIPERSEQYFNKKSKDFDFEVTGFTKSPPQNSSLTEIRVRATIDELW